MSTRLGTPDAFQMPDRRSGHFHVNWSFTAPGVYCLAMSAHNRLAESGAPVSDAGVLTVLVGDGDPYRQETCAERGTRPAAAPSAPSTAPVGETHVLESDNEEEDGSTRQDFAELTPRLRDGRLKVPLVDGDAVGPGTEYDDVVVRLGANSRAEIYGEDSGEPRAPWVGEEGAQVWELSEYPGTRGRYVLGWNTLGLDPDALDGDVRWSLTGVTGPASGPAPGRFVLHDEWGVLRAGGQALWNTRPGYEADAFDLWAGRRDAGTWVFDAPGVYCVGMRWSATRADGTPLSTEKTLTFVVGDEQPETVTPCVGGKKPTPPDDGGPPAPDAPGDASGDGSGEGGSPLAPVRKAVRRRPMRAPAARRRPAARPRPSRLRGRVRRRTGRGCGWSTGR